MSRMEQSQQREQEREAVAHCHWHPEVETGLSCGRCEKHICTQCMVQAPVGIRCQACGKTQRMPTYDIRPAYYSRAILVALAVAIGGGILWGIFNGIFIVPFLRSLVALVVGYGAGELISLSVNRKRGSGLAWIAGGTVVMAFLISLLVHPFSDYIFGLIFIAAGVYTAVKRVR